MEKREQESFLNRIVDLHHTGHKLQARAVLKALENTLPVGDRLARMNGIYLSIERLERERGFWALGTGESRSEIRRLDVMREVRGEGWEF